MNLSVLPELVSGRGTARRSRVVEGQAGAEIDPDWRQLLPSRLREGSGVGQSAVVPDWKPRNTERARELRNQATPAERLLWRYLARSQTGAKFSRQMQVGTFFADFLCRELKLVVEIDGFSHDLRTEYDAARDRWFAGEGYHFLHFTNADVLRDPESVAIVVREEVGRLIGPGLAHP